MQELLEALPTNETIRDFLNSPSTWVQLGIFLAGLLIAKLVGSRLQHRLQTMAQPGVIEGVGRTAMRTGALGLIPLLLWLWLLAAVSILHGQGWATGLLRPAMVLTGALAVIRMGVFVLRHSFAPGGPLKAWEGALTITTGRWSRCTFSAGCLWSSRCSMNTRSPSARCVSRSTPL